jgi:hypothetical protein
MTSIDSTAVAAGEARPALMSATTVDADAARRSARRGSIAVASILLTLVILVIALTPVSDGDGDARLTVRRYGPTNARLAYDLAQRLGWPVSTRTTALTGTLDTTPIYAVFAGPIPIAKRDRTVILDAVRHGAGLLVVAGAGGEFPLLDSLGLHRAGPGKLVETPLGTCAQVTDPMAALRIRPFMQTFRVGPQADSVARARQHVRPPATFTTLLTSMVTRDDDESAETSLVPDASRDSAGAAPTAAGAAKVVAVARPDTAVADRKPTMLAFNYGAGLVVALADPDILRTDQLRSCSVGSALGVVRGLEFLSRGGRREIVFAEYYQSVRNDGPTVVVREWLLRTRTGRALLGLTTAALLLIWSRGRRTLAPIYRAREERRSALEHVDALATAWRAVRGTQTVARMLARGIRRRHAAGRWRSLSDAEFLRALAARHPAIGRDAALLDRALHASVPPADLPALRTAAAHIDAECLTP